MNYPSFPEWPAKPPPASGLTTKTTRFIPLWPEWPAEEPRTDAELESKNSNSSNPESIPKSPDAELTPKPVTANLRSVTLEHLTIESWNRRKPHICDRISVEGLRVHLPPLKEGNGIVFSVLVSFRLYLRKRALSKPTIGRDEANTYENTVDCDRLCTNLLIALRSRAVEPEGFMAAIRQETLQITTGNYKAQDIDLYFPTGSIYGDGVRISQKCLFDNYSHVPTAVCNTIRIENMHSMTVFAVDSKLVVEPVSVTVEFECRDLSVYEFIGSAENCVQATMKTPEGHSTIEGLAAVVAETLVAQFPICSVPPTSVAVQIDRASRPPQNFRTSARTRRLFHSDI